MLVSDMNNAFGNPKGDFYNIDHARLRAQCTNIGHEFLELLEGLGLNQLALADLKAAMDRTLLAPAWDFDLETDDIRDALCDIQVFAQGAQHFMGVNGDDDMNAVIAGVMTRFIKDDQDLIATMVKHEAKGVKEVYFEGSYPTMVMKSARDQPDAPKGKFLKSASFKETVFPAIDVGSDDSPAVQDTKAV